MALTWWIYPTRRFAVAGARCEVRSVAKTDGLHSRLLIDGREAATDRTPLGGEAAVRNHGLRATLPDGRTVDVELGFVGSWSTGIVARIGEQIVHESHPGQTIGYPEKYRQAAIDMESGHQGAFAKENRLPFAVDVATGLLFFAVAKLTDLTTAALIGAAVGIGLVVFQRITRIDVTGGLALFGIVMLLISAGLALALQDEEWVKLRGTITGLIAASLFLSDGLFFRGQILAKRLMRFLPYDDIDPGRLGIGIGLLGATTAGINYAVAKLVSTDLWLFYTTFLDLPLVIGMFLLVMRYARTGTPSPRPAEPA